MSFKKWLENDAEHAETLRKTGFWGKQGAGSIVLARNTGRLLFPHRSRAVEQPGTWGVWGGAIDEEEIPQEAAKRELEEEAGYHGNITMIPLSVFQKNNFKYHNFLAIVDKEFKPKLNWETQGYSWTTLEELPSPLHFGVDWLLSKDISKIQNIIKSLHVNEMASFSLPHLINLNSNQYSAIDMKFEDEPKTLDKNGHVMNQGSKFIAKMPNENEYLVYSGDGYAYFTDSSKMSSLIQKGYELVPDNWHKKANFIK